jgi:hypothetical protein
MWSGKGHAGGLTLERERTGLKAAGPPCGRRGWHVKRVRTQFVAARFWACPSSRSSPLQFLGNIDTNRTFTNVSTFKSQGEFTLLWFGFETQEE